MANKPEATYRNSVQKYLDRNNIYFASMGGAYVAGVPDVYYEGNAGCLWVEWKNFQRLQKTSNLTSNSSPSKLSVLQQLWLRRATKNSVNTAVICGSPNGGVILPTPTWEEVIPQDAFTLSRQEIAAWITKQVYEPKT